MHELKLLTQHLTANDLGRIAAFLRVGSARFQCRWVLVSDGQADLLLSGRGLPAGAPGSMPSLSVTDPQPGRHVGRNALVRPLQYDAFVDALCALESRLLDRRPAPPAVLTYAIAQPLGEATPMLLPTLLPGVRCRLRRWPPSAVLQAHRHHRTLASFLSSRHLDLDELAHLSNVDRTLCDEFATTLITLGLLDVQAALAFESASAPASWATPSSAPPRSAPASTGLITRIRHRLGLTR
jgi:hypothetical protein